MDIVKLFKWQDVEVEQLTPLLTRQMIYGDCLMLSRIKLKKGSIVPLHQHENEQLSYIIEGRIRFYYGTGKLKTVDLGPEEVILLPSNVPHKAEALEDTLSLDIFNPPRQDWIEGTDKYIRIQN